MSKNTQTTTNGDTKDTMTETNSDDKIDSGTQVGLTDISYEGHTVPEPESDRVSLDTVEHDEFFSCSIGDVLWVDDSEYVVIDRPMTLISPSPLLVVGENGDQGELIAGELPDKSADGVTWKSNVVDKDSHEISRDDLICSYDRVYKLEEESLEHVHRWTPDTDQRTCPACGDEKGGEPLRIERQASKAVEIRQCSNTDCKYAYRFIRDFPEGGTADIVTYEHNGEAFGIETIEGVFRCEEQDDFKFRVSTHDGRDDGFYTASEIAEFLNPKMLSPELNNIFLCEGTVAVDDVFEAVDFVTDDTSIYGDDDYREIKSFGELYEDYASDQGFPVDEEIINALDDASAETFFRALVFLRNTLPDTSIDRGADQDLSDFAIESGDIIDLVADVVANGSLPDKEDVPAGVEKELVEAFTADFTGEEVITHSVFNELVAEHTEGRIFGVVDVGTNRSGDVVVTWKDDGGYDKMMEITFTEINEKPTISESFGWYAERHDLSDIAP